MTGFREKIESGSSSWSIDLSTHLASPIENETTSPEIRLPDKRRMMREKNFAAWWAQVAPPMAGYNCAGQVFASRRTVVDEMSDVEKFLSEDGFGEVSEEHARVGDVAVYRDDEGVVHVARIVGIEKLLHGSDSTGAVVRSKLDDVSGEYEHRIGDYRWCSWPDAIQYRIFRDRQISPRKAVGALWRSKLSGPTE